MTKRVVVPNGKPQCSLKNFVVSDLVLRNICIKMSFKYDTHKLYLRRGVPPHLITHFGTDFLWRMTRSVITIVVLKIRV